MTWKINLLACLCTAAALVAFLGCPPTADPGAGDDDTFDECVPDCDGMECGDDGCGGWCGNCSVGEECEDGVCEENCELCMETQCGYELDECNDNWECVALMDCLMDCSTESCMESCIYAYYDGADDLLDLLECVDDECGDLC